MIFLKKITKYFLKFLLWFSIILIILILLNIIYGKLKEPKLKGDWEFGQKVLQEIDFNNENFKIKKLRNFNWLADEENNIEKYKELVFNKKDIIGLEVAISHFSEVEGIGHVFLIFELKNGEKFGLSIESRRIQGEEFSLLGGVMYKYNLIYVLATEKDLLSLREKRNERIYIYPVKTTPTKIQNLFIKLSQRVNSLKKTPEFYHTVFSNCTNLIADEIDNISSDIKFPIWEKTFAPGRADRVLFEMGLLDVQGENFEEVKKKYLVDFKK